MMDAKEFFNNQVPTDANNCFVDVYARMYDKDSVIRFAEAYHQAKINEIMDKIKFRKVNEQKLQEK